MRVASLGSGSSGNSLIIDQLNTCILIDCGFSLKETERRLERLNVTANNIDALIVTHEHNDHLKGAGALARKYNLPVFLTYGTYRKSKFGEISALNFINAHEPFMIGDLNIQPVVVPHDANEPCQFIFEYGLKKLGVLTDLGSITPFIKQHYSGLNALLLECNYDPCLLEQSSYPRVLKQRISSDYGHLSNEQAAALLQHLDTKNLKHLVLMHLSQQNNANNLVLDAIVAATGCDKNWPVIADQDYGFDWINLL